MKPTKKNLKSAILATLLAFSYKTQAKISPLTGAFEHDLKITEGLSIKYNSRSLYLGAFGLGWCSPLDRKLDLVDQQNIVYQSCGEQTKLKRFGSSSSYSDNVQDYRLQLRDGKYSLRTPFGTEIFNQRGYLIESINSPKSLRIFYDQQDRIEKISIGATDHLIRQNTFGQIISLTNGQGKLVISYQDRLLKIIFGSAIGYELTYDQLNLQSLIIKSLNNDVAFKVQYDEKDRATKLENKTCQESADYHEDIDFQSTCYNGKHVHLKIALNKATDQLIITRLPATSRISRTPQSFPSELL